MKIAAYACLLLLVLMKPFLAQADVSHIARGGWGDRWLKYKGEFVYVVGFDLQQLVADTSLDYVQILDRMAALDNNKVRIWVMTSFAADIPSYIFPYARVGDTFDLETWNEAYWDRMRAVIGYAEAKEILVEVSIFDQGGPKRDYRADPKPWPFLAQYNLQGYGKVNDSGTFVPEFWDLSYQEQGRRLADLQKALIDKVTGELADFGNVYFELGNEFPGPPGITDDARDIWGPWALEMTSYMARRTDKPIFVHTHGCCTTTQDADALESTSSIVWDAPHVDGLNFHLYDTDPRSVSNRLHGHQGVGKAIMNNEGAHYYELLEPLGAIEANAASLRNEIRHMWGHVMAGGYFLFYHGPVQSAGGPIWETAARAAQAARGIVESVPFQHLRAVRDSGSEYDDIVSQGPNRTDWQVLADASGTYLIYFWGEHASGSTTWAGLWDRAVDLLGFSKQEALVDLEPGRYRYSWWDTRERRPALATGHVEGGRAAAISAPDVTEWQTETGIVLTLQRD